MDSNHMLLPGYLNGLRSVSSLVALCVFLNCGTSAQDNRVEIENRTPEQQLSELVQRAEHPPLLAFARELDSLGFSEADPDTRAYMVWRLASAMLSTATDDAKSKEAANEWSVTSCAVLLRTPEQLSIYSEQKLVDVVMAVAPKTRIGTPSDLDSPNSADRLNRIRMALHLWQRIDTQTDRTWEPSSSPPSRPLQSGLLPSEAQAREYRAAIEKYKVDIERYSMQKDLHDMSNRTSPRILEYVKLLCSTPPFESASLDRVVRAYVHDERVARNLLNLD